MTEVAIVSGANRGIGRAVVEGLIAKGLDVWATSRAPEGEALAREIGAKWHALDVTDRDSVAACVEAVGPVDVLVNNAGVALEGYDADVARRTLEVNVHGVIRLTDAFLGQLQKGGRVINVSSGKGALSAMPDHLRVRLEAGGLERAGLVAIVDQFHEAVEEGDDRWPQSAYDVSKAALNAFTRILDRELERDDRGLRVNSVCPGWVRTDMGGAGATRSPEEGADSIVWLATEAPVDLKGAFVRDRAVIPF